MDTYVKEVMSKPAVMCASTDSCHHAAELMRLHHIGSIPIVSDLRQKHLIGIVTDRDLAIKLVAGSRSGSVPLFNVMTVNPITCQLSDSLSSCEEKMRKHLIRRIPVVDDHGRCIGMVSQADIALHDNAQNLQTTLAAISKPTPSALTAAQAG